MVWDDFDLDGDLDAFMSRGGYEGRDKGGYAPTLLMNKLKETGKMTLTSTMKLMAAVKNPNRRPDGSFPWVDGLMMATANVMELAKQEARKVFRHKEVRDQMHHTIRGNVSRIMELALPPSVRMDRLVDFYVRLWKARRIKPTTVQQMETNQRCVDSFWSYKHIYWGAATADFDQDGWPDLIATSCEPFNKAIQGARPGENKCTRPWVVWRNVKGQLKDVSAAVMPYDVDMGELKGPLFIDYNRDGWLDLLLPGAPTKLFVNTKHMAAPGGRRFVPSTGLNWQFEGAPQLQDKNATDLCKDGWLDASMRGVSCFQENLVFAACNADFNQDGLDDLLLGYWNYHDLVMLGQPDGTLRAHQVIEKRNDEISDPRTSAYTLKAHENTMALVCGDFTSDGYPDAVLGSGAPLWGYYDIPLCNQGAAADGSWGGLRRCDQHSTDDQGVLRRGHGETRTHGMAMGDLDQDGSMDVIVSNGGFALADQQLAPVAFQQAKMGAMPEMGLEELSQDADQLREEAVQMVLDQNNCSMHAMLKERPDCDTRETTVVYSAAQPPADANMAYVRLQWQRGVGPVVGARLTLTASGGHTRYHTVPSAQGFQSQNSLWSPLALGPHKSGALQVSWPGGGVSAHTVTAGDRVVIKQPTDVQRTDL